MPVETISRARQTRQAARTSDRASRQTAQPGIHDMKDISEAGAISIDPIADVQGSADVRQIPINKVGIKDIYHPVRIKERAGGEQHTVANFDMYVPLKLCGRSTYMWTLATVCCSPPARSLMRTG